MTGKKLPRKSSPRPDYTRRKVECMVYTIEVVMPPFGEDIEAANALDSAIDSLRSYGSAEVVQVDSVSEKLDDAYTILRKRRV